MSDEEAAREVLWNGEFVDHTVEHEGATHTFIYDVDGVYRGVTLATSAPGGGLQVSVGRWRVEPHHEIDRNVWVRVQE